MAVVFDASMNSKLYLYGIGKDFSSALRGINNSVQTLLKMPCPFFANNSTRSPPDFCGRDFKAFDIRIPSTLSDYGEQLFDVIVLKKFLLFKGGFSGLLPSSAELAPIANV